MTTADTFHAHLPPPAARPTPRLIIDPAHALGPLKPINGVNNGPFCLDGVVNLHDRFVAARFADVRIHDANYPARDVCDINAVFPDPNADPADPASYDFARTDHYLKTIRDAGCTITYRLGYTIDHHPVRRFCHPPADFARWAQICVGIARHYNEGWAGGFANWVERWEIWNEPDNGTGPGSPCWTGTLEAYLRLYEVTAKALKAHNPAWRVGGPGAGGIFSTPMLTMMMEFCPRVNAPLDFYSWHSYENRPAELLRLARHIRATLDAAGFGSAQSVLNEWHSGPNLEWGPLYRGKDPQRRRSKAEEMNGRAATSYTAAALLTLQNGPVDLANYYTGDTAIYFGMFDIYGEPTMPYAAFLAFAPLCDCSTQVALTAHDLPDTLHAVAASSENAGLRVMVVNDSPRPVTVELAVKGASQVTWKTHHEFGWPSFEGSTLYLPAHALVSAEADPR